MEYSSKQNQILNSIERTIKRHRYFRIESEDQLDTAKKPGDRDENNKQDEDCEETNGIDMSEDFDSKLQDIEKRGDDSSDEEESDNEELDKEMGDTEQGADKYVHFFVFMI